MNRRNEREYNRFEDDDDPRSAEGTLRQREQSERGSYQRHPQASERGYDRGIYSQPGYAQRNYDENNFQRAGYDRNREEQYGQRDFGRSWQQRQEGENRGYGQHYAGQSSYSGQSNYSPRGYGGYDTRGGAGYDPSPRFGESIRSDWSSVNDSRGGWSRPSSSNSESWNLRQSGGFYGKGPKGYTRSDERIREDVCDRLSADDELDASDITVTVSGGEVTLEGTVPDRRSKHRAEDLSDSVAGVSDVHNRLRAQKGLVKEVSDKLLGRDDPTTEQHHAGSGTRNSPATSSSSGRAAIGTTNESLNHR
jgi:osmotically-inducible protein OsmY